MNASKIFSEKEIARIKKEYEQAAQYQLSDPFACLLTSRRIAEDICKQLVIRELAEDASGVMLHKLINKLSEKKILPYYVAVPLRTIQNYGNLGAHAQGKDAVHITSEFVQPCIQSLSKVVDWCLHAYRPINALGFTARKTDRQQIEQAGVELKSDLKIAYHEQKKDMDAAELLKMCQTSADVLQPIPSIFLFPSDTSQYIRDTVSEAGKSFKTWGNRVFSMLLPEVVDFAEVETFSKLFTILETILHVESQTPIERQRRIDAAVPGRTEINHNIDLLVQIRFPDSPLLGIESWPGKHKPLSVEQLSKSVNLKFPVNPQTGTLQAIPLRITVQAPDFVIHGESRKQIEVPPEQFSEVVAFLLTPKTQGICRINIEIYIGDEKSQYLGTIPVETAVHSEASPGGMHVAYLVVPVEVVRQPGTLKNSGQAETFTTALIISKNQEPIRLMSGNVLLAIEPSQAPIMQGFISPLLQMMENDEQVTVETFADMSGGFGSTDLPIIVVVPVIVHILRMLLIKVGEPSLEVIRNTRVQKEQFMEAVSQISVDDVRAIFERSGMHLHKKKHRQLTELVKTIIAEYMQI